MKEELYWGKLTWGLFHTIAEKIQDPKELNKIKNLIVTVCQNLPCPHCRDHAKTYLNKKSIQKLVQTSGDLKKYLWEFHNVVNVRTKKKIQPPEILQQYTNVHFMNLLNKWVTYFKVFRITPYTIKEHSDREKTKHHVYQYLKSIGGT
tara:strand:+ start:517 stop:960 length:444 start_codon:yes stop_codon:yes gene_type:complete